MRGTEADLNELVWATHSYMERFGPLLLQDRCVLEAFESLLVETPEPSQPLALVVVHAGR